MKAVDDRSVVVLRHHGFGASIGGPEDARQAFEGKLVPGAAPVIPDLPEDRGRRHAIGDAGKPGHELRIGEKGVVVDYVPMALRQPHRQHPCEPERPVEARGGQR